MRNHRKAKKGFVYILENKDRTLLKFGASRYPKERVRHINYKFKGNEFCIVSTYKSNDMFDDECKIKWKLWSFGIVGEIFSHPDITKEYMVDLAQSICGNGNI